LFKKQEKEKTTFFEMFYFDTYRRIESFSEFDMISIEKLFFRRLFRFVRQTFHRNTVYVPTFRPFNPMIPTLRYNKVISEIK